MIHAVVMAGGSGTRFWPISRRSRPKQLLAIGTEEALIVETVKRLAPVIPIERVVVVAGAGHMPPIAQLLPALRASNQIIEPCARNTAPALGLAAIHLRRRDPEAIMAVFPADHHIADVAGFQRLILAAAERAAEGEIVTLGIQPSRPETGYGYIRYHADRRVVAGEAVEVFEVDRFVEKPPLSTAERYLAEGGYLWNSGTFFFKASRLLADIRAHIPALAAALDRVDAALGTPDYARVLDEAFNAAPSISIDYGIMERAEAVRVIPAQIGWNDVGHWAALADFVPADEAGNVTHGPQLLIEAEGNITHSEDGRLIAALGVRDLVIVSTEDVVLVLPKDRAQDVRALVDALKNGREGLR